MTRRAMFDATGDSEHLDILLDHAEIMHSNRADRLSLPLVDEQRGKVMPAFISFNLAQGVLARQHAWLVHSAFVSHPVTYAIAKVNGDPQPTGAIWRKDRRSDY